MMAATDWPGTYLYESLWAEVPEYGTVPTAAGLQTVTIQYSTVLVQYLVYF